MTTRWRQFLGEKFLPILELGSVLPSHVELFPTSTGRIPRITRDYLPDRDILDKLLDLCWPDAGTSDARIVLSSEGGRLLAPSYIHKGDILTRTITPSNIYEITLLRPRDNGSMDQALYIPVYRALKQKVPINRIPMCHCNFLCILITTYHVTSGPSSYSDHIVAIN